MTISLTSAIPSSVKNAEYAVNTGHAGSADNATNATNANYATSAGNAIERHQTSSNETGEITNERHLVAKLEQVTQVEQMLEKMGIEINQ